MHRLGEQAGEQLGPCTVFNSENGSTRYVSHVTSIVHGIRSGLVATTIPTRRHSESQKAQQVSNTVT